MLSDSQKLAMTLLAIIIMLEIVYYMLYFKAPAQPKLTMKLLNNEAKNATNL